MNILLLVDMYVFCKMKSFTRCNFVNIYIEKTYEVIFIPINCHLTFNLCRNNLLHVIIYHKV